MESTSSAATLYCANCGDEIVAPSPGSCETCEAPGLLCDACFRKHERSPPLPRFRDHVVLKSGYMNDREELLRFFDLECSPETCASHQKPVFLVSASKGDAAPSLLCYDCAGVNCGHDRLKGLLECASEVRVSLVAEGSERLAAAIATSDKASRSAAAELESVEAQCDAATAQLGAAYDAIAAETAALFQRLEASVAATREHKSVTAKACIRAADAVRNRADAVRPKLERAAAVFSNADAVLHSAAILSRVRALEADANALASSESPGSVVTVSLGPALDAIRAALKRICVVVAEPPCPACAAATTDSSDDTADAEATLPASEAAQVALPSLPAETAPLLASAFFGHPLSPGASAAEVDSLIAPQQAALQVGFAAWCGELSSGLAASQAGALAQAQAYVESGGAAGEAHAWLTAAFAELELQSAASLGAAQAAAQAALTAAAEAARAQVAEGGHQAAAGAARS